MPESTHFELCNEPTESSLERIGDGDLTTLLAGGIVNPFGPTLTVVGVAGEFKPGNELPILHATLNPFSQSVTEVGFARIGQRWQPLLDLKVLFALPFGSCPTLLLPSVLLEPDEAVAVYADLLASFDEGLPVLKNVRRFPGDPWNRVEDDVNGLAGLGLGGGGGTPDHEDDQRMLTEEESEELSRLLLEPESQRQELRAFLFAWKGAIEFQGDGRMADAAMPPEAFCEHFASIAQSCVIPELGQ